MVIHVTLSVFSRTSMAFQWRSIAGLITPYITTAHYCLSISSISLDHHDNGICTQQWIKHPVRNRPGAFWVVHHRSGDVREEVRNSLGKVHIWKAGALSPLHHQRQLTDLQHQEHWCEQLCPSWPHKACQEWHSNPSHEPGLSSLFNLPWACNSIKHTHTFSYTPRITHKTNLFYNITLNMV